MSASPTTQASLLEGLRQTSNEAAWRRFVELYAPLVFGYFRRRKLQDADADDLSQEVMQVVARRVDFFEHNGARGAFRSWLFTICRHKLRQYAARVERGPKVGGGRSTMQWIHSLPAREDDRARWEREHQQRLFAWAAEKVRATVDEATWQAFWRTAVQGQAAREVAEALGKSIGSVYVAKSRVVARLRESIEEIEGD